MNQAQHFPDACHCGLTPQVKEIKTVTYVAICPCGNHGPAMQVREWAITEWNALASVKEAESAIETAPAP